MKNASIALGEALAEGAVIIPNVIFAGLIYDHYGNYYFLLPFVLLYSYEKAGTFAIQGFGNIKNPYRILECGLLTAILGTFLCIFGNLYHLLWEIGAILIGVGLSNYTALFRTIRDILKEKGEWNYGKSLTNGYFILGIIMTCSILFRHTLISMVFIVFFIILLIVYVQVHKLKSDSGIGSMPLFEKTKHAWINFLPAVGMLIVTFFTRLLKQTSDIDYILFMGLALCIFVLIGASLKKLTFRLHSIQTLWFGAIRNFLIIFSLMHFIAVDKSYMVGLSYFMIVLGIMLSMIMKKKLKSFLPNSSIETVSFLGSMISLILLLSSHTYLGGIMLCCAFVAIGNSLALQKFTEDTSLPILERRIVRSKFYGLGAVIQQMILLSVLIVVSWIKNQDSSIALKAYSFSIGIDTLQSTFFYTKLICIILIWISGVFLIRYTLKRFHKE